MNTHTRSSSCLQEPNVKENGEENMKTCMHVGMGRRFWVFTCPRSQNTSPKTDGFSNSNLDCHTLPIPCNNQLNQFLAVINDWVSKTRKVVDSLVSFPFYIWRFPIGPKGLNIPHPPISLGNHAPISLLLH